MEYPTLPVQLNAKEVLFLADSIANRDKTLEEEHAYLPLARETLLLLGSAYCELVLAVLEDGKFKLELSDCIVTVQIREEVAWLLKSYVKSGDVAIDGLTNVGVPLLLKLYDVLIRFNSGVEDFEVAGEDAVFTEDDKKALKEKFDARGPSKDTGSDKNSSSDGAGEKAEGRPRETLPGSEDSYYSYD